MVTAFFVAFSAAFGMAEAIRHTQQTARRKEHRSRKNNLLIRCRKSTKYSPELEGKHVVLSGDKVSPLPILSVLRGSLAYIFIALRGHRNRP